MLTCVSYDLSKHDSLSLFADSRRVNIYETFEKKINEKHALLRKSGRLLSCPYIIDYKSLC